MDITDEESILALKEKLEKSSTTIDCIVNNAGLGIAGPLEETSTKDFTSVFDTNVRGIFLVTKTFLPHLRSSKGRIINISSVAARFGLPFRSIYCASKASIEGIALSLRLELKGFGIQVCNVLPGDVKTGINNNRIEVKDNTGSPYVNAWLNTSEQINNDVDKGIKPQQVANLVQKLLYTKKLKARYVVAHPLQRLSVIAEKLLPQSIFEKVLEAFL